MFLMVVRVYEKDGWKNSIQYFHLAGYQSADDMVREAKARFHNILAADLADQAVTYNMAYIMDNAGNIIQAPEIFDRRPQPEPEGE